MAQRPRTRHDLGLRRNDLLAMMVACVVAGTMLGHRAARRTPSEGDIADLRQQARQAEEKIDPNTATVASLRRLPGIGRELAARIVEFRAGKQTPFRTIPDLAQVRGIGTLKIEALRPYVVTPE